MIRQFILSLVLLLVLFFTFEGLAATPVETFEKDSKTLMLELEEDEKIQIFFIRNQYGIVRAVDVVRQDVEKAIKACTEANPDMADDLDSRFAQWGNTIFPILNDADENIEKLMTEQTAVSANRIKEHLKLMDKAYSYSEGKVDKQPVTDEGSCKKLLKSLDRSEKKLSKILTKLLETQAPEVEEEGEE